MRIGSDIEWPDRQIICKLRTKSTISPVAMTMVSPIAPDIGSSSSFHSAATFKSDLIPSTQFINDYLDDEEKDLILLVFIVRSSSPLLILPALLLRPHTSAILLFCPAEVLQVYNLVDGRLPIS